MATAALAHPAPRQISVIIPVRNGAETLGAQLEALANQTYPRLWEVIVADNGSTDRTGEIARDWADRLPKLTIVDASERRGPGFARTRGAGAACGDFLLFCDADDIVCPEWIASMAASARDYDVVTGVLEAASINEQEVQSWRPPRAARLPSGGFLPFAPSGNLGVWADVFSATGGFDERYRQSEDVEWSWRVQLASYTLGFAPDAVVHYRYRTSIREVARQSFARGVCSVRLFRAFRSRGMRRQPLARALRRWAWVVVYAPTVCSRRRRGAWVRRACESAGRIAGSIEFRIWCP